LHEAVVEVDQLARDVGCPVGAARPVHEQEHVQRPDAVDDL